ncbi:HupE/UreJ family protein [Acuticoccus sp. M5D2P5]|uniref:HupE/UreJ family protein n=1 Tax=Acuticoccus kalidii TaxID=2910977 RepID=UPI001F1B6800|nr:HupE/UreJ family protein [Acuticoccus kalidii]MCF3934818.1 HupE/UreJ family protein [Acuticoccus kalidii]
MRSRLTWLLVLWLWFPASAFAHALDPAYLDLSALGNDRWRILWRVPDVAGRPMPLAVRLPDHCDGDAPASPADDGRAWTMGWIATCPGGLAGGPIAIIGLDGTRTDALVRYEPVPGERVVHRLTASEPGFVVPVEAGPLSVFTSYVGLGVTHILEGVDHLLFVLALVLLIRDRARLLWAVTAFTLAHSLTLGLASLGWLDLPPPPVEAVIALSIVFLAYELALPPERRDPLAIRYPWILAFGFGLIHGLGFAGALREIGFPAGDVPLALFAFNVGVELGQVVFIVAVLLLWATVRHVAPAVQRHAGTMSRIASYAIGSVAAFWVIERVAAF